MFRSLPHASQIRFAMNGVHIKAGSVKSSLDYLESGLRAPVGHFSLAWLPLQWVN
jgi:hypothetical protein